MTPSPIAAPAPSIPWSWQQPPSPGPASEDDNILVQGASAARGALAVVGHSYLSDNALVLRPVAVDAGQGPQAPTLENIASGAYPLSRPLFLYLPLAGPHLPAVRALAQHLVEHPELVGEVGYVPMPEAVRRVVRARLRASTPGSAMAVRPGASVATAFAAP